MHSAEASITAVEKAIQQVQSSSGFRQILRAVLTTGNLLNAGTNRGNAQGVKLDSLLKLADVKVLLSFASYSLGIFALCQRLEQVCSGRIM